MTTTPIKPYPADDHDHHDDMFNLGLQADQNMMERSVVDRRRVLTLGLGGIGLLLAGCGSTSSSTSTSTGTTTCSTATPTETNGPYPADGTNASVNALTRTGIVRQDIRSSTTTSNTAAGTKLTMTFKLVNINASCAPLANYAVYIWHCTYDGNYSMYSSGITGEDYLRGVYQTDSNGEVSFTTIFPGCYSGRWPHIHFEVYPSLARATSVSNKLLISQVAMPESTCRAVYATAPYSTGSQSLSNLNSITLATDNVFSDGVANQTPTMSGDASSGYTATLTVGISV